MLWPGRTDRRIVCYHYKYWGCLNITYKGEVYAETKYASRRLFVDNKFCIQEKNKRYNLWLNVVFGVFEGLDYEMQFDNFVREVL